MAIMTYADSREVREKFYQAYNTRCTSGQFNNVENLYKILELRKEKAQILGFKDFSDLVLADRMAKNGEKATDFVTGMQAKIRAHFAKDQADLRSFVQQELKQDPEQLKPWDLGYYAEKMRLAHYDFDEEELRPYFPLPKVMQGLFAVVDKTFGITVRENRALKTWDKDVTTYSAYDSKNGEILGHFYVDLFPRENKRGGAWMNGFITHVTHNDTLPHVGLIAGNFTPPTEKAPSLLTHDEVTTLFHEFGHLMHLLCSRTEMRSLSMDGVAWDFIELPSQILENWCWEREALDTFARHYETGATLPEDLFQKMKRAKTFRAANMQMRQLGFGFVDLGLHRLWDGKEDVIAYANRMIQQFSAAQLTDDYAMIASFTHLFASPVAYGAGYYSYKWAEVLDADAFTRFQKEGVFSEAVGHDYRDKILAKGDSEDPAELYRSFMGRDPDPNALLQRAGLA